MNADKQRAVAFLFCGVIFLTLTFAAAATYPERAHVAPVRFLTFLLLGPGLGVVLCVFGWVRLRKAKLACPEQSWPTFLRWELITVLVALVFLVVWAVVGESLLPFLHDLQDALHDFETVVHLAR